MYFAGMTILVLFVTRLGDVFGRKWPTWISAAISLPLHAGLLWSKSLTLTTVLLFFFGATSPGREQVSFVYMCELVPIRHRTYVGSLLLLFDATTILTFSLYYRFVSN